MKLIKKITLKHESRQKAVRYLQIKTLIKELEAEKKALEDDLKNEFAEVGTVYSVSDKTNGLCATIQEQGEPVYIVCKTTVSNRLNTDSLYAEFGITMQDLDRHKTKKVTSTTIEKASNSQLADIEKQ